MRCLVLFITLGACGGDKPAARTEVPRAAPAEPAKPPAPPPEDRAPMCTAFAHRVAECAFDESVRPKLTPRESSDVQDIAFAVCMRTTDDEAALRYYGDVDRKIACMKDKEQCIDVRVCLTRDGTPENP